MWRATCFRCRFEVLVPVFLPTPERLIPDWEPSKFPPEERIFQDRLAARVKSACLCAASLPHSGIKKRDGSIWASDSDGKLSCDMWLSFWEPCGNTQICASPSLSIFCRVLLQVCSLSFLLWFLHPVTLQPEQQHVQGSVLLSGW